MVEYTFYDMNMFRDKTRYIFFEKDKIGMIVDSKPKESNNKQ